jgi:hypothetical protein
VTKVWIVVDDEPGWDGPVKRVFATEGMARAYVAIDARWIGRDVQEWEVEDAYDPAQTMWHVAIEGSGLAHAAVDEWSATEGIWDCSVGDARRRGRRWCARVRAVSADEAITKARERAVALVMGGS